MKRLPAALDLNQTAAGYSIRRKAALARCSAPDWFCIARGCCSARWGNSVLCLAHGLGLGLHSDLKAKA